MQRKTLKITLFSFGILLIFIGLGVNTSYANEPAQQPTVAIPTVTGTPVGTYIRVNIDQDLVYVRRGPSVDYDDIGILLPREEAKAIGRSAGGNWIKIVYAGSEDGTGWIYAPIVTVFYDSSDELPIIEPPATSTPLVTPTINPTFAAQFLIEDQTTRQPTFTAPAPLAIVTYESNASIADTSSFPAGIVIILTGFIGILGALVLALRR